MLLETNRGYERSGFETNDGLGMVEVEDEVPLMPQKRRHTGKEQEEPPFHFPSVWGIYI